ncbi:hypothetical protein QZH41_013963 [Actinostola sp. cb2023]|nr:hypothetical protein QZH41_013963 [Actinostola sp. cb2023]
MPPKKKGKGKKKKGKGSDKDSGPEGEGEKEEPTEREQELRKERRENEWLQEEAQQTRLESHEYMSYMSKKTQKRQTTIISLSDRNQQEIQDINEQKETLLKDYEQKKEGLKTVMLEKEAELARTKNELADLEEYQEARQCLEEHTNNIKNENKVLRRELLQLIRRTRALHDHREELEAQHNALLREIQYGRDLKKLHGTRQNRLYKSFGIEPDDKEGVADEKLATDRPAIRFEN